ncbi:MAG TPA: chromosome segregation protein SMC [Acidimicrobiales bacterium]|nr:chromosome segregation protein SMC [Acidimicrobiales bacterium]
MFLKALTIKGFKSFADTTTLEFEPGITVVVGPNGSGKSNVVDAVAWVLGAQGARTLRGSKMEDVIFAGSANKPALGRAEVSLTIDNSAGVLDIGFAEVTITRTLFRSGDSEYAINGVPCRLLDIQELLSDSGVGRQQHVIVSQGQIDAVLNARPEDRRSVIEEAAGVLKYRKRREKAQRRLEATEANYLRLQDLLREVRRQLRPLERQADAARRHGALVEELGGLRLYLAGRELTSLRHRAEAGVRVRAELGAAETELKTGLARLDTDVLAAEATLGAHGASDLSEALMRFESMRERARGLAAVLAERKRGIERDRASFVDQAVIASLETDAARLREELAEVEGEADRLVPRADELAEAEAGLAAARAAFSEAWGDGVPSMPATGAAEVRGELVALRSSAERGAGEVQRLEARLADLDAKAARLAAEAGRLQDEIAAAADATGPLAAAVDAAVERRTVAERRQAEVEEELRAVEGEFHSWTARADALALALDEARARAGAERLADVGGVVGTLLDLIEVDEGWSPAFEAAAGEAIAAVVVDGVGTARRALDHLQRHDAAGAVLALGASAGQAASLPFEAASLGAAGHPVRDHVRSPNPDVEQLLDVLLAGAVAVEGTWNDALDLALAQPGLVVVTRDGDRFAAGGWRVGATGNGATGAALEEARGHAAAAEAAALAAGERRTHARDETAGARTAEAQVVKAVDENAARRSAAANALVRVEAEARDAVTEAETLRSHLAELAERVAREQARVDELGAALPALEAQESEGAEKLSAMQEQRARLDERVTAVAALRTDLEIRAAGLEERRTFLSRRLAEVDERLRRNVAKRDEAERGRTELESRATATHRLWKVVDDRLAVIEEELKGLREERRLQSEQTRAITERLDGLRRSRQAAERRLGEVRERVQRNELEEAEVRIRLEQATEGLRQQFDCEPETAMKAECPPLAEGASAPARVRELERELRLMGPINPLALEEFTQLQERHTFLEGQLEDVKDTRRDLFKVIRAIDTEIVEVFAAAYADVAENFSTLFTMLFPGGSGRLKLTDPDNLLETGIEVEARPSGKNVRQLSLLSGGERSLTALAFLFAVFRSRPSPFYLMDEVEAALDDVNLHRFLDLIDEFRREAQLVIVSHQKRTMEAADCLYGVTMQPGGSSRVVSERVSAPSPGR